MTTKHHNWGGARPGAGRIKGKGRYGEVTVPLRVPERQVPKVQAWLSSITLDTTVLNFPTMASPHARPLYSTRVAAGFPSPSDDHIDQHLDLNDYLIHHPAATFFVRVEGDSMIGVGIHENDILIVDRSLEPTDGKVVIAVVNGELTVKRLVRQQGQLFLMPENPRYQPLKIVEEMAFQIWGVVTNVIHSL